ncbi:hypothetical protein HMPREF0872_08915 [Veillonella montpellierensis DNF00314]|uniref:tRNA nuclease CdiA C-terminal domain-containing protein n=2 Tax=Veillonella montpellierensis TaxID=187328 RepID=A0A096CLM8_9FIRM|nr:hypothetical protein HMPREF0872_08915 [Veillonella montpellierensis DNF00314]
MQNLKMPDFKIGSETYELKTPRGNGKNTIYDVINKHKKQSNRFVISLDETEIDIQSAEL